MNENAKLLPKECAMPINLEVAGRTLCQLHGVDPDEIIFVEQEQDAQYMIYRCPVKMPRWRLAADEIGAELRRRDEYATAIAAGERAGFGEAMKAAIDKQGGDSTA